MSNLLDQAISCSDGDQAAKVIADALGIEGDEVASYVFPRLGRGTANSALASSASGCRPRRAFSLMPSARRFPPPWTVEEKDACFIVRDNNRHALAYVYFELEQGRRAAAYLLTKDEARRIAANIAKLPNFGPPLG